MRTLKIYSGHIRSYSHVMQNHRDFLGYGDEVHYNDLGRNMDFYNGNEWAHYLENKVPETTPNSSVNQWHNNFMAFAMAPKGYDVYIRMRYDIRLSAGVNLSEYRLADDIVYIPSEGDFWGGVNDRMAFGNYEAMRKYYSVYLLHPMLFAQGKLFHTEAYLKHTLDHYGVRVERLNITSDIIR